VTQNIPAKILAAADAAVSTERPNTHGDAVLNHSAIAIMWNAYITAKTLSNGGNMDTMKLLGPADAAQMMVLFKMARTISGNPQHADHYVDQAGYSALAARMWGAEPEAPAPRTIDKQLSEEEAEAALGEVFKVEPNLPPMDEMGFIRVPVNRQAAPDAPGINDDPMQAEREHYRRVMLNPLISGVEDDDGA
jgi:Domain of unknown function (DUF6378)